MERRETSKSVQIYTDGACIPNPGPGGWGAVLRYGDAEKELYGGDAGASTNNRMELTAPIEALESLTRASRVHIHTDSTYVRNGITAWLHRWKANGWRTKTGEPVKNAELWLRLEAAVARHDVEWFWVKGHAGNPGNERADRLALRGLQEAVRAAGGTPPPEPRRKSSTRTPPGNTFANESTATRVPRQTSAATVGGACRAVTKTGRPCPITARASGLCHVHDPALQCGAVKKDGRQCAIATGGGRCAVHQHAGA